MARNAYINKVLDVSSVSHQPTLSSSLPTSPNNNLSTMSDTGRQGLGDKVSLLPRLV